MPAEPFRFEEYALSGRGLMARPVLPNNVIALLEHIASIEYTVYNLTTPGVPETGNLIVADVMYAALQKWKIDKVGYTFLWPAPGTLWGVADKDYRIKLKWTLVPLVLNGVSFIRTWQVSTKDPAGT